MGDESEETQRPELKALACTLQPEQLAPGVVKRGVRQQRLLDVDAALNPGSHQIVQRHSALFPWSSPFLEFPPVHSSSSARLFTRRSQSRQPMPLAEEVLASDPAR
jgi:hypothetical protein